MSLPLISVIMPVYNGERYLAEALASIIAENYRPLEILLIDDGSTDGTARLAQQFPQVCYLHQAHSGVTTTLNHGLSLAQGAFLSFLDCDDLWAPDKLRSQLPVLQTQPNIDLVVGAVQQFPSPELTSDECQQLVYVENPDLCYFAGCWLIRREVFQRLGLLEARWRTIGLWAWLQRARDRGLRIHQVPNVVLQRRLHRANLTRTMRQEVYAEYLKLARERVAQQRTAAS